MAIAPDATSILPERRQNAAPVQPADALPQYPEQRSRVEACRDRRSQRQTSG